MGQWSTSCLDMGYSDSGEEWLMMTDNDEEWSRMTSDLDEAKPLVD